MQTKKVGVAWWRLGFALAAFVLCELGAAAPGWAFPPYRSTDAETAEEGTVEVRLGLVEVERQSQKNAYASPLLRMNLGLPHNVELLTEFEHSADGGGLSDAAIGFKWVPLMRSWSFGVETLALLPVSADDDGAGVESVALATFRKGDLRVHLNAGGFHDARPEPTEKGWRAGAIVEALRGRLRPGVEIFAKQVKHERIAMQAGPGLILDVGPFDIRMGLRMGLTREAPDLTVTLWVTGKRLIWRGRPSRP